MTGSDHPPLSDFYAVLSRKESSEPRKRSLNREEEVVEKYLKTSR